MEAGGLLVGAPDSNVHTEDASQGPRATRTGLIELKSPLFRVTAEAHHSNNTPIGRAAGLLRARPRVGT